MSELLEKLGSKQRKGSKPRCHWMTHGTRKQVAARLTKLIGPWGTVSTDDHWMPGGFDQISEAELHKTPKLLTNSHCERLREWWLAVASNNSKTPNFDLAMSCTIDGMKGIVIVEAKAHTEELNKEIIGKNLRDAVTANACRNHVRIASCIQESNFALMEQTGLRWALSHEWCYQMSNRFTWAWKLAELGYPVILVYLGFLKAEEMRSGKKKLPLESLEDWNLLVKSHSRRLFPDEAWDSRWTVHGQPFIPLIRSTEIPYDREIDDADCDFTVGDTGKK